LQLTARPASTAFETGQQTAARWWHDRALLGLLALFVLCTPLVTQRIYASDEIQYFAYTHSLFFDRDFDFSNEYLHFYESDPVKFRDIYEDLYLKREPLTGRPINVAPVGTGLLWLPSYALAHVAVLAANALGARIPADGYSQPYITAICLTSYVYGCAGLLLCYLLSRRLVGRRVSAVATAVIWFATPVIFYTVIAPPWSHATSLFAVTLFIWYWHATRRRGGEGRRMVEWGVLGVLAGLMMLVREQDALFMVVPAVEALWDLVGGMSGRVGGLRPSVGRALRRWAGGLVVMGLFAAVTFVPQLIAYKEVTGRFGPSQIVAGKFTWTSPNFLNVLFNPEHGMIPWTPVIAVALAGMVVLWRRDRLLTVALGVALLLQVYIAGSFLTWQAAGSFGQRRFINSTAIFVLGLAALMAWLLAHGWPRWLVAGLAALFVAWNVGLLMQYALWCSPQRQGLDWPVVLRGQLEMPARAFQLVWDYLTNRQKFYRSTRQC
jgi:hypothetical protein